MAILVYHPRRKTRDRHVVAAAAVGTIRTDAGAGRGRKNCGAGVAADAGAPRVKRSASEFLRHRLPHFGDEALLARPKSPKILLCIAETEYATWAAAHLFRVLFILPVVFPKTNRAQFNVAPAK